MISSIKDIQFPALPLHNHMIPLSEQPLTDQEATKLQEIVVSVQQSVDFERETRLQAECSKWFALRQSRLTASKIGVICKRRKDYEKLCEQLRRKVHATRAMKEGTCREPHAAVVHASIRNNNVNLYPCGLVIHSGLQLVQTVRSMILQGNPRMDFWKSNAHRITTLLIWCDFCVFGK